MHEALPIVGGISSESISFAISFFICSRFRSDSSLSSIIPENTKVLNTNLSGNCLTIDLSQEFIDNAPQDSIQKSNMIYTIVNTLTELKEVDSVKFLINGEEVSGFESDGINLTSEFTRKE